MAETSTRTSREFTSRALAERPKSWAPPEVLPSPERQPGYTYRWIRVATTGQVDDRNFSAKHREGWTPVTIEEQPQFKLLANPKATYEGSIEIGGLLLCKIPVEFMQQRATYYQNKTRSNMEAVDNNFMRENDARMPLFKKSEKKVSFGSGR